MRHYGMSFSRIIVILLFVLLPLAAPAADKPVRKTVYFSAITLYHPIVMYERYQPLMDYLTRSTPYKFELRLSQNYRDIINFLKTDKVQVALLGGVTYAVAKKEFGVIPILKPLGSDGKPFYRCVFVARSTNREINTIADLKGRSVAFASRLSTSGSLAPLYHLYAKAGIRLSDLSKYEHFKYHDSVAREVLRGNFDAGAVIDSVAHRFKEGGLKIIDMSEPIPGLPIVTRADAPPELVKAIKKALLSLHYDNPEDRKIMDQWDEEFRYGFVEAKEADYEPIQTMMEYLREKGVKIP